MLDIDTYEREKEKDKDKESLIAVLYISEGNHSAVSGDDAV